jgi:hypothetical protein
METPSENEPIAFDRNIPWPLAALSGHGGRFRGSTTGFHLNFSQNTFTMLRTVLALALATGTLVQAYPENIVQFW